MAKQGMRDADCSIFIANIEPRVSEEVLWELFLQVGNFNFLNLSDKAESLKLSLVASISTSSYVPQTPFELTLV